MATNYTTNYALNQWEPTDPVLRMDFNDDNAKLDAALKGLADQVAQKANSTTVSSLASTVSAKASQSSLNTLSSRVSSLESSHDDDVDTLRDENRLVQLAQKTLSADGGSFTFSVSGYPAIYKKLIFVCDVSGVVKDLGCQFNGDTTTSYAGMSSGSVSEYGMFGSNGSYYFCGTLEIMSGGKNKYAVGRGVGTSCSGGAVIAHSKGFHHVNLTYPELTSVKIILQSGNFNAGSSITLYGLK